MLCLRRTSQAALRASPGLRTATVSCRAGVCYGGFQCPPRAPFSVLSVLKKERRPDNGQGLRTASHVGDGTSKTPPSPPSQLAPAVREDIYTLPNILTLSRIAVTPFIGYFVFHDQHAWALGLFAYAGLSDLVDGWIARRWDMRTVVGTIIDPMADKMLMTVLTVSLAAKGALPLWVASIILGRDVGLAISALYYRYISLPPPKTFARYWDFSLPSAEVKPTTISKYNTALQLALVGFTAAAPVLPLDLSSPLSVLQYVVAATTIWSGASYVFSKDAVKILHQAAKKKDGR